MTTSFAFTTRANYRLQTPSLLRAAAALLRIGSVALLLVPALAGGAYAQSSPAMPQSKYADVNGVRLHYLAAGNGNP
jgi:hypothetical protein